MSPTDLARKWVAARGVELLLTAVAVLLVAKTLLFLYEGVQTRLRFRKLKAQGIVILKDHSLIFGHLWTLGGVGSLYPQDAQPHYAQIHIIQRWREYFPDASECPPIVYLDMWPVQGPVAVVIDPAMCQELVVDKNPPRDSMTRDLARPVMGDRSLISLDGPNHRLWRSRLNPGFSLRNLQSHMPSIIDEVEIFVRNLKATTREDGSWGHVFPLLQRSIDLTFDVIGRVILDLHLDEQQTGPTKLQSSLRTLGTKHFFFRTLWNLPTRLNPLYHYEEWRCTRELRAILIPRIKQQIGAEQATTRKTVVQLAMKEVSDEKKTDTSRASISEIVEDVFGMTRLFLFAGHDTTATIITWSFHYLSKNPHVLELLRAEHNKVFGPDPSTVSEAMRRSPQLLNSIPYTLAVAKEVLRLSPLAASIRRGSRNLFLAHGEALLPTDGFAVITGTAMIDYHPDLWPRVNEFLPERWVVPPGDPLYPSKPGQWRPFEYGAMNCIGQELSMIEIKLVLLYVVRELDIEPAFQEWDKLPENLSKPKHTVGGERAYRLAEGMSPPTEGMPVHVRLRRSAD